MRRSYLRRLSFAALAAALALWWFTRPEPAEPTREEATQAEGAAQRRAGGSLARLQQRLQAQIYQEARVTLVVRDESYLPLAGVRLRLLGVEGPWLLVEGSAEAGIAGAPRRGW